LFASRSFAFLCLLLSLLGLTSIPASGPVYNRFWQVLARPADDLAMHPVLEEAARYCHSQFYRPDSLFAATSGLSYVICAQKSANLVCGRRSFYNDNSVPAYDLMHINEILREWRQGKLVVVLPDPTLVFTPYSFAAICSHHWLPQEVALAVSGVRELQTMTSSSHLLVASSSGQISFYQNK